MLCRRPRSTLIAALAGTVLLTALLVHAITSAPPPPPSPGPVQMASQPLAQLGGGRTVREIHQDTPFSMVALTSGDLTGTTARVRAQKTDGSWGPWYDAETLEGVGPTGHDAPRGTEPVFVGRTTTVQIEVTRPPHAPVTGSAPPAQAPRVGLGYIPATVEQPFAENINAVLISPPQAPIDMLPLPNAATPPGQPPAIISRAAWGADESMRCGEPRYDNKIQAGVVHHSAGSNDYAPEDSAGIVRSIYEYHTRTLGWCDIAYNALVDKYGQVFEGRAGGMTRPVEGSHTGGFNHNTWGVAMLGNFTDVPPTPIQLRTTARLLGWVLGQAGVDPLGTVVLPSEGGAFTKFPFGSSPTLPTIFTHRDVGNTECPGNAAYALMPQIRQMAAQFNEPPGADQLIEQMRGGAILTAWEKLGGVNSYLGKPTSPEASGEGAARYATFEHGAVYWSPSSGAQPITGELYNAWGTLGFERGALGLPTSAEIPEPLWIVQNFQHGTLNFDREKGTVTRVTDGVPVELIRRGAAPVQLERFTPPINPA
ncbi:cold-shock protein [Mycolicibacterium sp. 018/SC-01/001]|uniref:N-acetylmuramoyl-L-alanine amidase n=1 Tax=Mycolicibacterium sp. 018/SC-01/001 TaxID=2592069 RepID=UPI00117E7178|nr:N-acetylmuramoyl-L-alanine amidase [Mycolicibacterium sp. 018/SC-01/001]TRW88896.1 cold-shock protein [Mycolicibacterium sp. 018/SC-01/001]